MGKCGKGQIWYGSKNKCIKDNAPHMVGDGKLPNKYWVSAHNEYQVLKDGVSDGVSQTEKDFKIKGGTLAVFDTFEEAEIYSRGIPIGIESEMRALTIEDRISGEVYAIETLEYEVRRKEYSLETRRSTDFTEKTMRKRGHTFR